MDKYEKINGANAIYVYVLSTNQLIYINNLNIKVYEKFGKIYFDAMKILNPDKNYEELKMSLKGIKLKDIPSTIFISSGIGIKSIKDLINDEDKLWGLSDFILEQLKEQ
ncbi:MAG: hypothetical protein PHN88_02910 [Ignavibacteria bacterium]|nr:hypothetical protein [Ignavibacteria bacterium]